MSNSNNRSVGVAKDGQLCSFEHAFALFLQFNDVETVAIWGTHHTSLLVDSRFYEVLVLEH